MPAENIQIATLVPDHEMFERIGRGGYGEVWLARNRTTDTLRAVKIVFRHEFEDERPYRREFEGLLKFEPISRSHPSQLAILHVGRNDETGCFYYVMELADPFGKGIGVWVLGKPQPQTPDSRPRTPNPRPKTRLPRP